MDRPSECRWCGCGVQRLLLQATVYKCWSTQLGNTWDQSAECKLKVAEDRIQRAVDTLKAAKRYRVTPVSSGYVEWDTDEDGPVTDSAAVDEALAILEGERDEI